MSYNYIENFFSQYQKNIDKGYPYSKELLDESIIRLGGECKITIALKSNLRVKIVK